MNEECIETNRAGLGSLLIGIPDMRAILLLLVLGCQHLVSQTQPGFDSAGVIVGGDFFSSLLRQQFFQRP
jgi:hypothetical protein